MPDISLIKAMVPQGNLTAAQAAEKITAGWWIQQKYDGRRIIIATNANSPKILILNRDGTTSNIAKSISTHIPLGWLQNYHRTVIIDGEYVNKRIKAFDLIHLDGEINPDVKYSTRYKRLKSFLAEHEEHCASKIRPVSTLTDQTSTDDKYAFIEKAYNEGAEGIILRNRHASYRFGRSNMVERLKFRKRIDAFVTNLHPNKASATLALWDPENQTHSILCDVSILYHNVDFMSVVEIEFSHLSADGKPQQPVIKNVRNDKVNLECTIDQLEDIPTINNEDIAAMKDKTHGAAPVTTVF